MIDSEQAGTYTATAMLFSASAHGPVPASGSADARDGRRQHGQGRQFVQQKQVSYDNFICKRRAWRSNSALPPAFGTTAGNGTRGRKFVAASGAGSAAAEPDGHSAFFRGGPPAGGGPQHRRQRARCA